MLLAPALGAAVEAAASDAPLWRLGPGEDLTHAEARKSCERLEAEGRGDWRLPTPDEIDRLAATAAEPGGAAAGVIAELGGDAAWTHGVSRTGLAWAAAFAHGFQLRIHAGNDRALRALCVSGAGEPAGPVGADLEEGPWQRALDVDTDSPLLWGCSGTEIAPKPLRGSVESFRQALPPGPIPEPVPVDFVIDEAGRVRWAGPGTATSKRLGLVAVETLETFRFEPATCDGEPVPVYFHLDFGTPRPASSPRSRAQSKLGPGSLLRPGATSEWPARWNPPSASRRAG